MNKKDNVFASMGERLINGLFKENPTFVLLLGMCPTLAVTTSAMNGLGMGLTTTVVLAMSNLIISALRKVIPNKIRIPAFIVIIASFVTIVELLLEAYIQSLYSALGIYIPLIVVNCIILGRAEAYAYSNPVLPSLFDGLGMGLGFTMALTIIGGVREIIGSGAIFGVHIMPASYIPVSIFVMAPGAFFVLAILTAIQNKIKEIGERKGRDMSKIQSGCGGNCLECELECKDRGSKTTEVENKPEENINPEKTEKPEEKNISEEAEKSEEKAEIIEEAKEEIKETVKEKAKAKGKAKEKTKEKSEAETVSKESSDDKTEETVVEEKEQAKEVEDKASEAVVDDLEEIELDSLKKLAEKKSGRRPSHKKGSKDKAMMMLSKAEETLKEDENNA